MTTMKLVRVTFLGIFVLFFVAEVYSLNCLRCNSTDVNSRCRFGSRSKNSNTRQVCGGTKAVCFAVATVNEYGSAYFQRGCTLEDVCQDRDDTEIEFCRTCKSKFCNYDVMELDPEVEDYLNEVRNYNVSRENRNFQDKNNTSFNYTLGVNVNQNSTHKNDSEAILKNVEDTVLNDEVTKYGTKLSPDITFADEDVDSILNENIVESKETNNFENFDVDVRMSRRKSLPKYDQEHVE